MRLGLALSAALAIALAGCAGDDSPRGDTVQADPASAPITRSAAEACLEAAGATLGELRASDARLRSLRDLAQGRSIEVRAEIGVVYLAFARDVARAELLAELLEVPGGPYKVQRTANVVVLYRPEASELLGTVSGCLVG